ncbi:hypothetical protein RJ641_017753, partial [Dillenia turbinata]
MTCAHGVGNRLIQEMFNHSGETVYEHFHRVLGVINKLAKDIIKPHPHYNDGNCIGAIDSTHIKVHLPRDEEIPYIGRKGYPMQN